MIRPIVRDMFFLGQKLEPASRADVQVGRDRQDTLNANRERCEVRIAYKSPEKLF